MSKSSHVGVCGGLATSLLCVLIGVLGTSAQAAELCPNEQLRAGLSANLPDCRAYELVTPPHKGGVPAYLNAVAPDGSSVIVHSTGNFGDLVNSQGTEGGTYELTRTATGWSETDVDPPALHYPYDEFLAATPDLGATLWDVRGSSESLYAHDLLIREADGALHDLGPEINPAGTIGPAGLGAPLGFGFYGYGGASSDFSRVLYWIDSGDSAAAEAAAPRLWPGDKTAAGIPPNESLYERVSGGGFEPVLVGVKNEGRLDGSPHVNEGAELISECGINLGSRRGAGTDENAVSESGATVFFTARHSAECSSNLQPSVSELYARIGGVKTVAISEPILPAGEKCTVGHVCFGAAHAEGSFQGASRDGSKVFFLTAQPLLNGDEDETTDLYEAEIEGEGAGAHVGKLIQVSHDPNAGQASEVQGVTRISADGSHVYFVANGVLAANSNGQAVPFSTAHEGADNLYVYEADPANPGRFKTVFIAMLCSGEGLSGSVNDSQCHSSDERMWNLDGEAPAQTTPDGRFLVFSSAADLTAPEDTGTVNQLFRYDAETGELARVSIGQDGFNANGNTDNGNLAVTSIEPVAVQTAGTTAVSEDGSVVFQSADGLTPAALNGQEESFEYEEENEEGLEVRRTGTFYANNVYEWEADGTEVDGHVSCGEPAGCVYLISDGLDTTATGTGSGLTSSVALEGQTPSNGNIFLTTADQLVPQDTDTAKDVYDARIGGGFPPPLAPAMCEENCQGEPGTQQLFGVPSSAMFSGAGNLTPPPEAKPTAKPKPKPLTRAQQLAKALKACHAKRDKRKQASCERHAHKRYGAKPPAGKSAKKARR
jgi:hypothetical protein